MAAYHLLAGDGHVGKDAMTIPDYVAVAVVIVLMLWAVAGRSVDYLFGRRRSPTAAAADWEFAAVNAGADCDLMALIVPQLRIKHRLNAPGSWLLPPELQPQCPRFGPARAV
jgi:hypothetical protein